MAIKFNVNKEVQVRLGDLIDYCTGCGACEHLCPVRPLSAIHVEGHEVHKMI